MSANKTLKRIQTLYLNPEGADVWFVFENERIPAHKLLLTTMSPWLQTMFEGSLPEGDEVSMVASKVTVAAFKEFLRFSYLQKANLTMDNIGEVLDLAKQSLNDEFVAECEDFLIKNVTRDTMCSGYQLAILYDINRLKKVCEEEICVFAEEIFQSSSFLKFKYELLLDILRCDSLSCDEKHVFNGCIAWAKAACERDNQDPAKAENLRAQLKECIYQIRFYSMPFNEFAECVRPFSGLFTADEYHELVQIMNRTKYFKPKLFNWTPRYYGLSWDKEQRFQRIFECTLFKQNDEGYGDDYNERVETTSFTCNRRVLLNGFTCGEIYRIGFGRNCEPSIICISEQKIGDSIEYDRYNATKDLLLKQVNHIKLKNAILLRPGYIYSIKFSSVEYYKDGLPTYCSRKSKKTTIRLDHDIVLKFSNHGIISRLSLKRFDNRHFFRKIVHNPKVWLALTLMCISFTSYFMSSNVIQLPSIPRLEEEFMPIQTTMPNKSFSESILDRIYCYFRIG